MGVLYFFRALASRKVDKKQENLEAVANHFELRALRLPALGQEAPVQWSARHDGCVQVTSLAAGDNPCL